MSKYATRDWHVNGIDRSLTLSLQVEVNGRVHRQSTRIDDDMRRFGGPPMHYIEREMREVLMRAVETELLGPRP